MGARASTARQTPAQQWGRVRTCLPGGALPMTTTTDSSSEPTPSEFGRAGEDFTTSEGLRALLHRLHEADVRSWREDPYARALMLYAAEKYEPLARKHDLDPWEAATAAFEVMRTRAAREAADPWAVITHAVRITCIFEQRAQGLLCSVHQARRPHISALHDPERFSDRETPLTDYHPAFHIPDPHDDATDHSPADANTESAGATMSATAAVDDAVMLFTELGCPCDAARAAIDYVCTALTRAGSRQSAFEALRRDRYALA